MKAKRRKPAAGAFRCPCCGRVYKYKSMAQHCTATEECRFYNTPEKSRLESWKRQAMVIDFVQLVAAATKRREEDADCRAVAEKVLFNNCVSNLEWCTPKQNVNYGTRNERANAPLRKRVKMYTKDGVFIREFTSTREAERQTGICSSSICCCCNKKPKFFTAGGYRWQYAQLAQEGGDVQ